MTKTNANGRCNSCLSEQVPTIEVPLPGKGNVWLCMKCLAINANKLSKIEGSTNRDNDIIWASSGYGHNTKRPFITLESNHLDMPMQMEMESARDLVLNLLQVIEGAETDAFLIEFFGTNLDQKQIAALIYEFRQWRDKKRNQKKDE